MNIDDWKSQVKRGTLEFCILLLIKKQPSYGYEIISTLDQYPIIAAKRKYNLSAAAPIVERRIYFFLLAGGKIGAAAEKSIIHLQPKEKNTFLQCLWSGTIY